MTTQSKHLSRQRMTRMDGRPRGHVVGRAVGEPLPAAVAGSPRGHVVGRAVGEPLPAAVDGQPRGHVIGRAVGAPLPAAVHGQPRGHVIGRAVASRGHWHLTDDTADAFDALDQAA